MPFRVMRNGFFIISHALAVLPSELQLQMFNRLGFRRQYLISTDISFESLASILHIKLLSQDERLVSLFDTSRLNGMKLVHSKLGYQPTTRMSGLVILPVAIHHHRLSSTSGSCSPGRSLFHDSPQNLNLKPFEFYESILLSR